MTPIFLELSWQGKPVIVRADRILAVYPNGTPVGSSRSGTTIHVEGIAADEGNDDAFAFLVVDQTPEEILQMLRKICHVFDLASTIALFAKAP